MTRKCYKCGSPMARRTEDLSYRGVPLGRVPRYDCRSCGEQVYPHVVWQAMERADKLLQKRAKVRKPSPRARVTR